jgi:hypothetical protein
LGRPRELFQVEGGKKKGRGPRAGQATWADVAKEAMQPSPRSGGSARGRRPHEASQRRERADGNAQGWGQGLN